MFFPKGSLSERRYRPSKPLELRIPMSDGVELAALIVQPAAAGPVPVLLGFHPYPNDEQFQASMPEGFSNKLAHVEAGDSNFFARHGYVHVVASIRGTGGSGGLFDNLGRRTVQDIHDTIEWLARQPFCDGKVGMFGMSYFAIAQMHAATLNPPALKAIFAPYAWTDMYRDRYYRGGILVHGFMRLWIPSLHKVRVAHPLRDDIGDEAYAARIEQALADPEIAALPYVVDALRHVEQAANEVIADTVLQPLDNEYYRIRSPDTLAAQGALTVPAYLGADWGIFGLHLPGALRSWEHAKGPRRLTIGPPLYLDRPIYQYHNEALRWFDHWLKGNDTGMLEEPAINLFIEGTGEWKSASSWPLPETRFTPFYLLPEGLLSEHAPWVEDATATFTDAPGRRGGLMFWTPQFVESTEVCGPICLELTASTSDTDVLWFISLHLDDPAEGRKLLTRGWLRGSQRRLDVEKSKPWQPVHTHDRREPLEPGAMTKFSIEVRPYGILLKPGQRLGLGIRCCDDEQPKTLLEAIGGGCISRQSPADITVSLSPEQPSWLVLPITRGNRIGTFFSGGIPAPLDAPIASRN